jgi:hypothetical protein
MDLTKTLAVLAFGLSLAACGAGNVNPVESSTNALETSGKLEFYGDFTGSK